MELRFVKWVSIFRFYCVVEEDWLRKKGDRQSLSSGFQNSIQLLPKLSIYLYYSFILSEAEVIFELIFIRKLSKTRPVERTVSG